MKSIKKQVSMGVTASLALLLGLSPVTHQAQATMNSKRLILAR